MCSSIGASGKRIDLFEVQVNAHLSSLLGILFIPCLKAFGIELIDLGVLGSKLVDNELPRVQQHIILLGFTLVGVDDAKDFLQPVSKIQIHMSDPATVTLNLKPMAETL